MKYLGLVLALAVVGVGVWLLVGDGGDAPEPITAGGGDAAEETQPELEGMAIEGTGPAPDATENPGRGEIVGTVRLASAPVPASVELRVVAPLEGGGAEAMFDVLGKVFVERLLDGGVARGGALDRVQAGEDGAFRFRDLGPGLYELRARDAQDRRAVASVSIPADGARVSLSIDLPSGDLTFSGRVVFDDGTPFRGTVIVSPGMGQMSPFLPARGPQANTDAEGRFSIGGLAPGAVMVTAIVPGSIRAMGSPIQLPYEGEFTMTVGAGGIPVKGKVVAADTNEPIAGASVIAGGGNPGSGFMVRTTTSDAEGRFELSVPGVEGGMLAMAEGYGTGMVELRGERPEEEITVPLPRLATVSGVLTSKEGGEPLPNVPVYAVPGDGGMGGFTFPASTVTDAEGRYRMEDVHPGTSMVFAYGRGWVGEAVSSMSGRPGGGGSAAILLKPGEEKEKDLVAVPAGRVEGRVTTGGRPIRGAVVSLERQGDFMLRIGAMLGMGTGLVNGVTDAEGRYVIDAVVPETDVRVIAKAVGYAQKQTDSFRVASGDRTTQDFELVAARWMTITVVDADSGAPVPNAMVVCAMKDEAEGGRGISGLRQMSGSYVTTDAKGHARVGPLAEGVAGVRVQASGFLEANDWTWFDAGATEGTVKLQKGLEISGRVALPPGVAAAQVEVRARYSGDGGWQRKETAPKPDGTFTLTGLKHGVFRITARAALPGKRFEAKVEGVEAGTADVVLELTEVERGSMLTVKVVDADGTPVTRARVSFRRRFKSGGSATNTRTLSAGRAVFELEDDRVAQEVYIEVSRVEGGQGGALYHGPIDHEGGEIEVTLGPPQQIRGRVQAAGKPVAGVKVTAMMLRPGKENETTAEHASTLTDEAGRYTLDGLGPYAYQLQFHASSQYAPADRVRAQAGDSGVDAELELGATAVVTVLDDAGQPVSGARVHVNAQRKGSGRSLRHHNASATTDSRGEARLEGLPHGATFRLSVSAPNARTDLQAHSQEGWSPGPTTVRLERAYGITGTVVDKSGAPLTDGDVNARLVGGDKRRFNADPDEKGRFELKRLPPGEYELWFEPEGAVNVFEPGRGRVEPKRLRARAGAKDLTLQADLGLSLQIKISNWSSENRWQHGQLNQDDGRGNGYAQVGADGVVRFHRLAEGRTYTFTITGLPGGRYVYKSGLRPGDAVTLRIQKGRKVTGRVRIPDEAAGGRINVNVQGTGFNVGGRVEANGRFTIEGVPEGTWKIRAYARKDGKNWSGEAEVAAGGDVEIPLSRQ